VNARGDHPLWFAKIIQTYFMLSLKSATELPLKLLLVEDEPNDQTLFCAAARKSGWNLQIRCVGHGQEAVEYLEGTGSEMPDVLVLDLRMPVMDGFELLAWCQTSPRFQDLPVVVLSGSLDEQWGEQARAMGAGKFYLKPSRLEEWTAMVREIAEFARLPDGPALKAEDLTNTRC
jgi:two-component system, response regulator